MSERPRGSRNRIQGTRCERAMPCCRPGAVPPGLRCPFLTPAAGRGRQASRRPPARSLPELSAALARTREYAEQLVQEAGVLIVVLDTAGVAQLQRTAEASPATRARASSSTPFSNSRCPSSGTPGRTPPPAGRAAIDRGGSRGIRQAVCSRCPCCGPTEGNGQVPWTPGWLPGEERRSRTLFGPGRHRAAPDPPGAGRGPRAARLPLHPAPRPAQSPGQHPGHHRPALEGENDPERREMLETVLRSSKRSRPSSRMPRSWPGWRPAGNCRGSGATWAPCAGAAEDLQPSPNRAG